MHAENAIYIYRPALCFALKSFHLLDTFIIQDHKIKSNSMDFALSRNGDVKSVYM